MCSRLCRHSGRAAVVVLLLAGLSFTSAEAKGDHEICITFDELPAAQGFSSTAPDQVLRPILKALKKYDVKAAGFVVGQNLESSFDLLGQWLNDGHCLGNLTYSYSDLNEVGAVNVEAFIADIVAGQQAIEPMLEGFGQQRRYFRYPFLHYGTSLEMYRAVAGYLDANDIAVAHASVIVDDYLYDLGLQKVGGRPTDKEYEQLMNEYVNRVLDQIEAAEVLAKEILGRPCRQILQLRANQLNAMYLDVMLQAIKDMGYEFISLDRALQDEAYQKPHAYFGGKGVGYLEMIDRSDPDLLPAGE